MNRGLTAEIDLRAASRNFKALKKAANSKPVISVVKADAYGHGAVELSRAFLYAGAYALAVAFLSEAVELRESGIEAPIIVLFDSSEPDLFFRYSLTPVLHDYKTAKRLSGLAKKKDKTIEVHVKIDTGMGRMGVSAGDDVLKIAGLDNIRVSGLMSHMSEADVKDRKFALIQLQMFLDVKGKLNKKGIRPMCHIANSASALSMPQCIMDAVRPGIALYGVSPFDDLRFADSLKPVMSVKSKVLAVRKLKKGSPVSYGRTFITKRDTVAAVIAGGYAEGYMRALSNSSSVIINGVRAPVMGRVCMDLTVVDATDAGGRLEGAEAVLLGRGGDKEITAWELARAAGTIPYEVLTSISKGCSVINYTGA